MTGRNISIEKLGQVPDELRITRLLLPGTHDTMTSSCSHPYYRTQDLSLIEQLEIGIRFLDLRLLHSMVAAHREWVSNISADSIMGVIRDFLHVHPSEFLITRVQNANEAKDDFREYGKSLLKLVEAHHDLFWTPSWGDQGTVWPTVGEVRGKVIALECAPASYGLTTHQWGPWASPWHDNPSILLQDNWDGPRVEDKIMAIRALHTNSCRRDSLFLNHVSATNGTLGTPQAYADILNPVAAQMVQEQQGRGILILDFASPKLVHQIWEANDHNFLSASRDG